MGWHPVYDLFLSYHWRDHETVERVAHALRERGVSPFLDRWYLPRGQPWVVELESRLADCRALAVFYGPEGLGSWQQRERQWGLDRQASDPKFPVIPALLPGAAPVVDLLRLNTWVDLRNGLTPEAIENLANAAHGKLPGPGGDDEAARICPYRGLQPFREEDAGFFCGRLSFTEKLVAAVEAGSFVAVVGASGSGKSSVVRAGLIPALRHRSSQRKAQGHVWDMVAMRPLEQPLHSLATCLLPLLEPDMDEVDRLIRAEKLSASILAGDVKLRAVVERVLEKQPGTDRLLLVVDQWEELYTLCRDDGAARAFVDQLLDASTGSRLSVVITLRGDFFGHALGDRRLSDRLQNGMVTIGPMTRDELRAAIVEPAKKVKLRFEDGLDTRILSDLGEEPGNLPLLEFLLTELWHRRRGSMLLHEAYGAIGGVRRAIAEHADRAFGKLSAHEQEAARWALMQLVAPGEGALDSRRRALLGSLDATEREVVTKLAQDRLLVTRRDEAGQDIVEIGHEALIREWGRLRGWLNEDREFLRVLIRLDEQAALWYEERQPNDLLLRARRRLAEAEELLKARPRAVSPALRVFLDASLKAERERQEAEQNVERERLANTLRMARRTRNAAVIVSVLFAVASIAAGFALYKESEAKRAEAVAKQNALVAERNAQVALKSATDLVVKVGEHVDTSEITSRLARDMLKAAEQTLAKLEEMRGAPDFTKAQILLLTSLSDVYTHLGATGEALERARKGKALVDQLADPIDRQRALFLTCFRIGDALADQGYLDNALVEYRIALDGANFVSARIPDGPVSRGHVSFMHNKVGDILRVQGFQRAAMAEYEKSLAVMRDLAREKPGHPGQLRSLAAALNRVGDGLRAQGNHDAALDPYLEALAIYRGLAERNRVNASLLSNYATSISNIGNVYRLLGDFDRAMQEFQESLRIRREMAQRDLSNATWQNLLSFVYIRIGETLSDKADFDGALAEYRKALNIRQKLADSDPKNALRQSNLASTLSKIGDVQVGKHDPATALAEYRKAFGILDKLAQTTDGKFKPERDLFATRIRLGGALLAGGKPADALAEFTIALQITEPFLKRDASDSTWQTNSSAAQKRIGDALTAQNDLARAIGHYLIAVDVSDQVWRKDTANAEQQVALADNHLALAAAYYAQPNRDKARERYKEALDLLRNVTTAHPNNRIWARKLNDTVQKAQELALLQ